MSVRRIDNSVRENIYICLDRIGYMVYLFVPQTRRVPMAIHIRMSRM